MAKWSDMMVDLIGISLIALTVHSKALKNLTKSHLWKSMGNRTQHGNIEIL